MTRETKIGLIVAGSFLCLVGIVVASKWRGGDATDAEEQTVVPGGVLQPTPPPDAKTPGKTDAAQKSAFAAAEKAKGSAGEPKSDQTAKSKGLPGLNIPPTPTPTPTPREENAIENELERKRQALLAALGNGDKPAPAGVGALPPGALPLPTPPGGLSALPMPTPTPPGGLSALPMPTPTPPGGLSALPMPTPTPPGGLSALPMPTPTPPGGLSALPMPTPTPPGGLGALPTPTPTPPGGLGTLPTPPGGLGALPTPTPTPPGGLGALPPGGLPLPTPTPPGGLPLPTPNPFAKDGGNRPPPPPGGKLELMPVKPFDDKTPIPEPKPAAFDPVGGVLPAKPIDPAPGPIAVIPPTGGVLLPTPPISVQGARPAAAVNEVNTDLYECQKGDTTFAILSLRMYNTDKYADALLKYNRAHSGMVKNGSTFNFNPPVLSPGQQVLKPPQTILDRDYGALIRTAPPQVRMDAPTPLTPTPTPSIPVGPIAKVSNPPALGPGGTYTVQNPGGETLLDIADRVFGDRSQWHKIYRVNPNYPPQNRIPAGTTLTLPSN